MSLRDLIRELIREEKSTPSPPAPIVPSTETVQSQQQEHLKHLEVIESLKQKESVIETEQSQLLSEADRISSELNARLLPIEVRLSQLQQARLANMFAIENELAMARSTCSVQLIEFMEWANDEQSRLSRLEPEERFGHGAKNILADTPRTPRLIFSNAPAIARRLQAVRAARSRAEELKVLDRTEDEIREELAGLRESLPAIDNCEELVDRI